MILLMCHNPSPVGNCCHRLTCEPTIGTSWNQLDGLASLQPQIWFVLGDPRAVVIHGGTMSMFSCWFIGMINVGKQPTKWPASDQRKMMKFDISAPKNDQPKWGETNGDMAAWPMAVGGCPALPKQQDYPCS